MEKPWALGPHFATKKCQVKTLLPYLRAVFTRYWLNRSGGDGRKGMEWNGCWFLCTKQLRHVDQPQSQTSKIVRFPISFSEADLRLACFQYLSICYSETWPKRECMPPRVKLMLGFRVWCSGFPILSMGPTFVLLARNTYPSAAPRLDLKSRCLRMVALCGCQQR